jgi:hypothetical protein
MRSLFRTSSSCPSKGFESVSKVAFAPCVEPFFVGSNRACAAGIFVSAVVMTGKGLGASIVSFRSCRLRSEPLLAKTARSRRFASGSASLRVLACRVNSNTSSTKSTHWEIRRPVSARICSSLEDWPRDFLERECGDVPEDPDEAESTRDSFVELLMADIQVIEEELSPDLETVRKTSETPSGTSTRRRRGGGRA